ncbi:hypothetical protein B0T10DRAFT_252027 [Thelonectria olida]|uniref:F-box domain-containing protein n=1 Tax=Thelonectria olida TaxID=1576542 RepID=A0A9P9AQ50_9HYPO|nr:hypothetical protein B0T10DRAFT_252027 [Thelonectria olida]
MVFPTFGQVCAFCGAAPFDPNQRADSELEDLDEWELYDETVLPTEETVWMGDTQLIGENPNSERPNKVFLSGPARDEGFGHFTVLPNENDWVPIEEVGTFATYSWSEDQRLFVPCHAACVCILAKTLQPHHLDLELLYQAVKSCFGGYGTRLSLKLNYGGVVKALVPEWQTTRGTEVFASPPFPSPKFDAYYSSLALPYDPEVYKSNLISGVTNGRFDVFSRLAPELLLRIMEYLDMPSTIRWRTASRAAAMVTLGNFFWKMAVSRDMPWVYDHPELQAGDSRSTIDWKAMYAGLHHGSRIVEPPAFSRLASLDPFHSLTNRKPFNSLANRKRIWEICSQITEVYLRIMKNAEKQISSSAEILVDAVSTPMPRLVSPESTATTLVSASLFEHLSDLQAAQPVLSSSWSEDGYLLRIDAHHGPSDALGSSNDQNKVRIPENDWLTGFVITTKKVDLGRLHLEARKVVGVRYLFVRQSPVQHGRSEGDQRLIYVSDNHFVVGFSFRISLETGSLESLALLQQLLEKAPGWTESRLSGPGSETLCSMPRFLWKDGFPRPELRPCPYEDTLFTRDDLDLCPIEALILEDSEKRLSDIVALSADVHMRMFQVQYADGSRRSIGSSCHALKSLPIDGAGGERVVMMFLPYASREIMGIRFATNRGRQLVLGWPSRVEARYPPSHLGEHPLMGICSFWKNHDSLDRPQPSPGKVYSLVPSLDIATSNPSILDLHGLCWEPIAPPESITRFGPIYGAISTDFTTFYSKVVVSWLDCSRPLHSVTVAMCNAVKSPWMPLCSLAFTYADTGECAAIGPTEFPSEEEPRTQAGIKEEYDASTWTVNGSKMTLMKIWLSHDKSLRAMQFVAENGLTSPKWGLDTKGNEDEVLVEIGFSADAGDDQAVGIAVYMMSMMRTTGPEEEILLSAFQALQDDHMYR